MQFGFITLDKHVPSTRFRFLPYLQPLRQRVHRCRLWMSHPSVYEHYPAFGWRLSHAIKRSCRRLQAWEASVRRLDAIYLEGGCLNDDSLDFDRRFRKTTGRLILDVDDGIFLKQPEKIDPVIAMSDHGVVSNEWIGCI